MPAATLGVVRTMAAAMVLAGLAACAPPVSPAERAVTVSTTGCGDAFETTGSGVLVEGSLVVTAAHLVLQADIIRVVRGELDTEGTLVGVDRRTDLALVEVGDLDVSPVGLGVAAVGSAGSMVRAGSSAVVPLTVLRVADLRIEETLGSDRVLRRGLEVAGNVRTGDSGAGIFGADGSLLGVVFAVASDGSATAYATSAEEIEGLLDAPRRRYGCDEPRSRMVAR